MTIHRCTIELEGETYHWASLDGEHWLPVSRPPADDEAEQVQQLFDGDGNMKPLTFTRRLLKHRFGADLA